MRFINSAINNFESKENEPIIPNFLFNDFGSTFIVLIDVRFCNKSEKISNKLLKTLKVFTKE